MFTYCHGDPASRPHGGRSHASLRHNIPPSWGGGNMQPQACVVVTATKGKLDTHHVAIANLMSFKINLKRNKTYR